MRKKDKLFDELSKYQSWNVQTKCQAVKTGRDKLLEYSFLSIQFFLFPYSQICDKAQESN
jgi:hypothetical protein